MTNRVLSNVLTATLACLTLFAANIAVAATPANTLEAYGRLPIHFEESPQTPRPGRFVGRGAGYAFSIAPTEVTARLGPRRESGAATFRILLAGGNPAAAVRGSEPLPGKSNYLIGNDPSRWRTGVDQFAQVHVSDVYRGIDVVYYGNQRQLEYDFVVAPHANPDQIRLRFEGADKVETDASGDLVLHSGNRELRQRRPVAYQDFDGVRTPIQAAYRRLNGREWTIGLASYDATHTLIIDPVLTYSTYLGGSSQEILNDIAVDSAGNAYVVGSTNSANFPTTAGVLDTTFTSTDGFISKINATGSALVYSTYIGGTTGFSDSVESIAVDGSGIAYITGGTDSSNFPMVNPIDGTASALGDMFIAKLDASGAALIYSTYLGGNSTENGYSIAIDASGNAYVAGGTFSTDFPTVIPIQAARAGGNDGFVLKVNAAGSALDYSTYLGGTSGDNAHGIVVDGAGNAYVMGETGSTNFPVANALQPTSGGSTDAFVTKINAAGTAKVYSTYLGGSSDEFTYGGIAIDSSGNAYVTGETLSANFPTTAGVFQTALAGARNAFVTKYNAAGSAHVYSTYLGGTGTDQGIQIAVDSSGNAHVIGIASSTNFPTASPLQGSNAGGNDAFITKVNATGSALLFSTYLGGTGSDTGGAIALDSAGNIYVAGNASSTNFPTASPFQASNAGSADVFIAKITTALPAPTITNGPPPNGTVGVAYTFNYSATNSPTFSATGTLPTGLTIDAAGVISGTPTAAGTFAGITVTATNGTAPDATQNISITIAPPAPTITNGPPPNGTVGAVYSFGYTATNSPSFSATGTLPTGLSIDAAGVISGTPTAAGTFAGIIVTATNGTAPDATQAFSVTIAPAPFAYISNQTGSIVSVIDTATNTVVATVPVGASPFGVAVNLDATRVYVGNRNSNNVSVINTATNTVVATVAVGTSPLGIAVNPAGTRTYVTNVGSATVSVIDTSTNTVIDTVTVGTSPYGVAFNPAGTRAYVVNQGNNNISVIDTTSNTVIGSVAVGTAPSGIAVNLAGTLAYVANFSNTVSVIDLAANTVIATVAAGTNPLGIAVSPAGTRVYVANSNSANVSVIDTATNNVVATVAIGSLPRGVAVSPDGTRAYAASQGGNNVAVIDTATNVVVATVTVGVNPGAFGLFIGGPPAGSPPTITNGPPPNGTAGLGYSFTYTSTGSPNFSVTSGSLPPGLSLTANVISGTPTTPGTFTGMMTASNGTMPNTAQPFSITIAPLPPTITNGPPPNGTVGVAYSFTYTSTSSPTFSATGTLPTGLSISPAGVISGIPTAAGTFAGITVTATNGTGPDATQTFAMTIAPAAPTITNGPPPNGVFGVAYSFTYTSTSSPTFSATGTLPTGLSISPAGVISGTPTTPGTFAGITVTATNGTAPDATQSFSMTIAATPPPAPTITNGPPPNGTVGATYSFTYTATDSPTFSATGTLPTGLTLSPAGVISGTPTVAGTFAGITVTATNGTAPDATQNFAITIAPAAPTITNGPPPNGTVGVAYSFSYTSTNSPTFSATGTLPTGLSINSAGMISGTPTAAGTFSGITVTATNGTAPDATQNFAITIAASAPPPPTITNGPPPNGTVGIAYSFSYTSTNSPTFSATGASPTGLSISSAGVISGTPTVAGTFSAITVTATNGTAPDATQNISITITPAAPTITSITPTSGSTAGGQSVTITGMNLTGATSVTFDGTAGTFTVDSATSITVTTPAHAAGAVSVTVTTAGGSATGNYTYVTPPPTITSVNPISGQAAGGESVTITGSNLSGATSVTFGGTAGAITANAAASITVTAPAHAVGTVDVTVTTAGGSATSTGGYSFGAVPTITKISPTSGPLSGGQSVTITGTNLSGTTLVRFAQTSATIQSTSATTVTVKTPAHAAEAVNVTVTTPEGSFRATDGYAYVNATTTAVVSSQNPSFFGQSTTFTASVSGSGATGTVTFKDGSTTFGTGTLSGGKASFSTTALATGTHSIKAVYGGDSSFASSTSAVLNQIVHDASAGADLAFRKTALPGYVAVGENLTYTLAVTNNGPAGATGVTITDPLPDGMAFVSASAGCSGTSIITCAIGSLAKGSFAFVAVVVRRTTLGAITNSATVDGLEPDPDGTNNSDSATSLDLADMSIEISGPAETPPGATITYISTVMNLGPADAVNVRVFNDNFRNDLNFVSNTGGCATAFPCSLGTLPPNQIVTITSTYVVNPLAQAISNRVVAVANNEDPEPSNNLAVGSTTVLGAVPVTDLWLFMGGTDEVHAGSTNEWNFDISNRLSTATAVTLNVTVAGGTVVSATVVSGTGCTIIAPTNAVCSLPDIATLEHFRVTLRVMASENPTTSMLLSAAISAATPDRFPLDNSTSRSITVHPLADMEIVKTGPRYTPAGENILYSIIVRNLGPSDAANVVVSDPAVNGITFVSNAGGCTTPFPCSLGTLAVNESVAISSTFSTLDNADLTIFNTATVHASTRDPRDLNQASWSTTVLVPLTFDITSIIPNRGPAAGGQSVTLTGTNLSGATSVIFQPFGSEGIAGVITANSATQITVTTPAKPTSTSSFLSSVHVTTPRGTTDGLYTYVEAPTITNLTPSTGTGAGGQSVTINGTALGGASVTIGGIPAIVTATTFNTATFTTPAHAEGAVDVMVSTEGGSAISTRGYFYGVPSISADLALSMTGIAADDFAGFTLITYILRVTNSGSSNATGLTITDRVPNRATFVSGSAGCSGTSIVTCNVGTLAAGAIASVEITFRVPAPGALFNGANVVGLEFDPNTANNAASANTAIVAANLKLSMNAVASFTRDGDRIDYSIAVRNDGPATATGVTITDSLPIEAGLVSASEGCSGKPIVTCNVGILAVGATATLQIVALTSNRQTVTNTATVVGARFDLDLTNNTASATVNCPTEVPNPLSPRDVTNADRSGLLRWTNVQGPYNVYLGPVASGGCSTLLGSTAFQVLNYSGLTEATDYEWRVEAATGTCPVRTSACVRFRTGTSCTIAPVLRRPADNAEASSPVLFAWEPVENATSYQLRVARGSSSSTVVATTNTNSVTVALDDGPITWSVVAFVTTCGSIESKRQALNICNQTVVPRVVGEITSGQAYQLEWEPVSGALRYQVAKADNPEFTNATIHESTETFFSDRQDTVSARGVYYRVKVFSTCVPSGGPFSETVRVVIIPLPSSTEKPSATVPAGSTQVAVLELFIPGERGQSFNYTVTTDRDFVTISPLSGLLPPEGVTLRVSINPTNLPNGTSTGTIILSLTPLSSAGSVHTQGTTTISIPVSISLVTPVSPVLQKETPSSDALIFPTVGHLAGASSQWRSDIRVSNISTSALKYNLTFTPSGGDLAGMKRTTIDVAAGSTIALDDIVRNWYGLGSLGDGANGTLEIRATATDVSTLLTTVASSRTYNATANGTLGQFVPAIRYASFIGRGSGVNIPALSLQQLAQTSSYRTNVGLVEASGSPATLLLSFFGDLGAKLFDMPVSIKANEQIQLNSLLAQRGLTVDDGRAEVRVIDGIGKVTAYASTIDNRTNDPLLVSAVSLGSAPASKWVLPGVASLTSSAHWQTDMRVFNSGDSPLFATLTYYPQGSPSLSTQSLIIDPGEVKKLDNVLPSLFGVSNSGGAVHVATPGGAQLVVTGRTYNQTDNGTLGQFIPAVTEAEAVGRNDRALQVLQVEDSPRQRTNLGLAEASGMPVTVEVLVHLPDSKVTPRVLIPLGPNEFRQFAIIRQLGLGNVYNARISIRVIEGDGRVTAYGSIIDELTQDPTYVPAQ